MQDVSPSNVKLLDVHTREVLYNTGMGRDFLKKSPMEKPEKTKAIRVECRKMKNFYTSHQRKQQ